MVDSTTIRLLSDRHSRLTRYAQRMGFRSLDEAVNYLLTLEETVITLEDFIERTLDEFDGVAQIALLDESEHMGELMFRAHVPVDQFSESHGTFDDVDLLEVAGQLYKFRLDLTYDGPQDLGCVTAYASDNIIGMNETPHEEGLEAVKGWVVERDLLSEADQHDDAPTITAQS